MSPQLPVCLLCCACGTVGARLVAAGVQTRHCRHNGVWYAGDYRENGVDVETDAGVDVETDAGVDVETDAGVGVATDAGVDAETDAGNNQCVAL